MSNCVEGIFNSGLRAHLWIPSRVRVPSLHCPLCRLFHPFNIAFNDLFVYFYYCIIRSLCL